jgi:ElaA protein
MPDLLTTVILPFDKLSTEQLYALLRLRSEIFVVEQMCIYQDVDDKDRQAEHLLCYQGEALVGYARLLPPGLSFPGPSIGRVCVASEYRGLGYAQHVMRAAIAHTPRCKAPLEIGAQVYLQAFYARLGFTPSSEPYDEDGIMHIDMQYPTANDA